MKRLRKRFKGKRIRFFICVASTANSSIDLISMRVFSALISRIKCFFSKAGGNKLWTSATLEGLWKFGFSSVGEVTFESAAYVARYCLKKVNGDLAKDHYAMVDLDTGEVYQKEAEFSHMSLKPGIGALWLQKV